jgi:hypothetical protein
MAALRELLATFQVSVDPEGNLEKGNRQVDALADKMRGLAQATRLLGAGAGGGGVVRGLLGAGGGAAGGPLAMLGAGTGGALQIRASADGLERLTSLWGQAFPAAAARAQGAGSRIGAMLNGWRESLNAPGKGGVIASLFTLQNGLAALAGQYAFGQIKGLVDQIGGIGEEASRLGVTNAEFQRLDVLAKQNATSVGALGTAFRTLATNAVDPSKEAAEAFSKLGVEAKDSTGALKSRQDLFFETAGALADIEDTTTRAALAQRIYGRGALELAPLLAGGRAGLEAQRAELEKLPMLNDRLIASADKFSDSWETMKAQLVAVAGPVLEGLVIPALQLLVDVVDLLSPGIAALTKNLNFGRLAFVALLFPASRMLSTLSALVSLGGGWTKVLGAMGGGVKRLVVQFAPLIGAFLILEDVLGFFTGKDSLIGRGLEKAFPGMKKNVEDLRIAFQDLWKWVLGDGAGEKAKVLFTEISLGLRLMINDALAQIPGSGRTAGLAGLEAYERNDNRRVAMTRDTRGTADPFLSGQFGGPNLLAVPNAYGPPTSVDQSVRSVTVNMLPSSSPDQVASKVGAVLTKDRNAVAAGVP